MVYDKNLRYLLLFLNGKIKANEGCSSVREATLVSCCLPFLILLFVPFPLAPGFVPEASSL